MVAAVQADVSTEAGIELVVTRTVERFGGLDILINNVGRAGGSDLIGTSDAEWQAAFDETLFPAIRASRLAVPHMKQRGGGVDRHDRVDLRARGRRPHDLQRLQGRGDQPAKSMAQQLASVNIRVNSVAPGSILFPGGSWHKRQQADPEGIAEFVKRELPFGRFGRPEEVGSVVAFLASSRASWMSGACVVVDGCQGRSNI